MSFIGKFVVLVCGPSSSGKTSAVRESSDLFQKIYIDDIIEAAHPMHYRYVDHERYYSDADSLRLMEKTCNELIIQRMNRPFVMIDYVIEQGYSTFQWPGSIKILLYAPLEQLLERMLAREQTEPRGLYIFEQFANAFGYLPGSTHVIDTISCSRFVKMLKDRAKCYFRSDMDVNLFARRIMLQMNIPLVIDYIEDDVLNEDVEYPISVMYRKEYDYVIDTRNKTPEQIALKLGLLFANKIAGYE